MQVNLPTDLVRADVRSPAPRPRPAARLALVRHDLATVARGDAEALMTDPDCRFLADFLAAAPEPEGPSA